MQSDGAGLYATAALGQRHEDNQLILKSSETTLQEKEREKAKQRREDSATGAVQCLQILVDAASPLHISYQHRSGFLAHLLGWFSFTSISFGK